MELKTETVVCEERDAVDIYGKSLGRTIWLAVHYPSGKLGFGDTKDKARDMAYARTKIEEII